jgi:hypothetical protein
VSKFPDLPIAILTAVLLILAGGLGWPGVVLAALWLGVGVFFVLSTKSRGLLADATFILTWPFYVVWDR